MQVAVTSAAIPTVRSGDGPVDRRSRTDSTKLSRVKSRTTSEVNGSVFQNAFRKSITSDPR